MYYDLIEFSDGVKAVREMNAQGQTTRYCTLDGVDIGRLFEQVNIVGTASPDWAQPDPVVEAPVYVPPVRRVSKLQFVARLGSDFATILTAAKVNVDVEMFVRMLDWATPEADGTSVDLDDPRVVYALNALEAGGLIASGRAAEVLNA